MSENSITKQIISIAFKELEEYPEGLQYSRLHKLISESNPSFNSNTINGQIWDLDKQYPKEIYKPSRGLFRLIKYKDEEIISSQAVESKQKKIKEEQFYKPFADWLVNELEECTKAIPLGGNRFKSKWGTPDVIGIRLNKKSDIYQAPMEIVSAEIKTDTAQLITAFGQTCSYRLFSHKSYLVIPEKTPEDEIARLDSLCMIFGIGLILFNSNDIKNPNFTIRVRALKFEPDIFYVNQNMKEIEAELFS